MIHVDSLPKVEVPGHFQQLWMAVEPMFPILKTKLGKKYLMRPPISTPFSVSQTRLRLQNEQQLLFSSPIPRLTLLVIFHQLFLEFLPIIKSQQTKSPLKDQMALVHSNMNLISWSEHHKEPDFRYFKTSKSRRWKWTIQPVHFQSPSLTIMDRLLSPITFFFRLDPSF